MALGFLPQLLMWCLLHGGAMMLHLPEGRADTLPECSGRRESPLCAVTGPLDGSCPRDATFLMLLFREGASASWPEGSVGGVGDVGGGLRGCDAVNRLKVTGWNGPELAWGHLRQLRSLTSAEIVDGGLERVGANATPSGLSELSLARNKIATVHDLALAQCHRLVSLDLSDNRIVRLPDRFLSDCGSLRILRLSGNRLTELQSAALLGAGNLRELLLQKNRFQLLHNVELGFVNNRQLSLIDLRGNGLFSYQPGRRGFCGPANVTVRMHFSGCPPKQAADCNANPDLERGCVGSTANLLVTFSCQVSVDFRCRARALPGPPAPPVPTCPADAPLPASGDAIAPTDVRFLSHLGVARDGAWLVYALAAAVIFAVLQLIVSLAVCHRLKLRLARLQVRAERLADECPSHHRFFQHPTLCSQSALSDRLTPSGKAPSSHCGFSQWGETPTLPLPPPPPQQPQQLLPLMTDPSDAAEETAAGSSEQPLRLPEDD